MTPRANRRVRPRQERSRFLVDAILEATARLLGEERSTATMTRIAKVAGVSVGSLYRYFPAREAVVGALIDQRLDRDLAEFRALLAENEADSLREGIEACVALLVHDDQPRHALLRGLVRELHASERYESVQVAIDRASGVLAEQIAPFEHEMRDGIDIPVAAHALVWATRGAYLARLRVEDPLDTARLRDELIALALGYLVGPG